MKAKALIIPALVVTAFVVGFVIYASRPARPEVQMTPTPAASSVQQIPNSTTKVNHRAGFAIFTQGTIRIFSDPKYHNRSVAAYLTKDEPGIIHIKQENITWQEFFDTMPTPMKVTSNCLMTGTGQSFCNGASGTLKFYLNGKLTENLLSLDIQDGDKLLVSYGANNSAITQQQARIPNPY